MEALQLQDLYKIYKSDDIETVALRGASLVVQPGEFVAITGRSGAGKSTLLNIIGGLSLPSAGRVVMGGVIWVGLARLLVMLLGVVFTIPAKGLDWPSVELASLGGFVLLGMLFSTILSTQRLAKIKVVEALREL